MLFCIPYLYAYACLNGSIFPQVKNHAVHGKNPAAHGAKTPPHLV